MRFCFHRGKGLNPVTPELMTSSKLLGARPAPPGWLKELAVFLSKQTLLALSKAHRFGKGKRISASLKNSSFSAYSLHMPEEIRMQALTSEHTEGP